MATWAAFEADQPTLAATVRDRFDARKHKTMATLRADGSPRISGIEAEFEERTHIGEEVDALTGGEARFRMLAFDGFSASAFADLFLVVANLGNEFGKRAHVGFEAERAGINFSGEHVVDRKSRGIGAFAHGAEFELLAKLLTIPAGRRAAIRMWEEAQGEQKIDATPIDATIHKC